MKNTVNGIDFKEMLINAGAAVENQKQALNELNVFPVPDGDTGTNMSMTINYAIGEIRNFDSELISKMSEKIKQGLTRGSHGNSGVITSLLFNGMSKYFEDHDSADPITFAYAMKAGADKAYSVVNKPTEGTILTVARKAAERAIELAATGCDFNEMLSQSLEAAYTALALTPTQNPVLAKAGVVDAGAKGYCYILEGMLASVRGIKLSSEQAEGGATQKKSVFSEYRTEDIKYTYCTEFIILRGKNRADAIALRAFLGSKGDSLVMAEDDDIIKIHVHTNNPGLVLEEALKYGSLTAIKIENMREQHTEKLNLSEAAAKTAGQPKIAPPENKFGFVSVAAGEGIKNVFKDLGADNIVEGGQTMNPSTEDILRAINGTPAETVFVFPNNKNIIMAAEQAAGLTEKKVVVIPTRTIPEGITAMLAYDPESSAEDNAEMMKNGISGVRTAHITYAARDSVFDGTTIKAGDYLVLAGGKLKTGSSFEEVASDMADSLRLNEAEFVTIFRGADASDEISDLLMNKLKEKAGPNTEFNVIDGGQPVYYFIIGVE